jgi:hypothetical protein
MSASSSTVREATIRPLDGASLTRFAGWPTFKRVKITRNKIAAAYSTHKATHPSFPMGNRFSFAAAVMKTSKFIRTHNSMTDNEDDNLDDDWEFERPVAPAAYNKTIAANVGDNTRCKQEAQHSAVLRDYDVFAAYETIFKDRLAEVYDATYLRAIKDDVLGFLVVTVRDMLNQLESRCLAISDHDEAKKIRQAHADWDKNDDIWTFFQLLNQIKDNLEDDYGIIWLVELKIIVAMEAIYKSGSFDKTELKEWENQDEDDKTWVHRQNYFGDR